MNKRAVSGIVLSIVIFTIWIVIDIVFFPSIIGSLGYPVFEIVAYGSWFMIMLILLAILSVTRAIPTRFLSER